MPDSVPSSPTSELPAGGSDFTVPGTWVSSSLTVSEDGRQNL